MGYWTLWFIGIGITILTAIAIRKKFVNRWKESNYKECSTKVRFILNLLVIICIILVGGIANGKWLGIFANDNFSIGDYVLMGIVPAILTYVVGFFVLGLSYFESILSQICFAVVFIVSIIGWTMSITNYNQNIVETTQTIVKQTEERELLYFCNIPLQEVSGSVSGSFILGTGAVSGQISTSDNLPYWYLNEKGEGLYDSALSSNSKIIFIEDGESPYLEIITYCTNKTTTNHNDGTETTSKINEWTEYYFYLPDEIMQYNLN